jgi:hypothetical protein
MVHESQEGNLDLQRKSAMNEKQDYETYGDVDGSSVAFLFPFD